MRKQESKKPQQPERPVSQAPQGKTQTADQSTSGQPRVPEISLPKSGGTSKYIEKANSGWIKERFSILKTGSQHQNSFVTQLTKSNTRSHSKINSKDGFFKFYNHVK